MSDYKIKSYPLENGQKVSNIWNAAKKQWVFEYACPKHRIAKTDLHINGKEIFRITDKKGDKPYLFDVIAMQPYEMKCCGMEFKELLENDFLDRYSIYRGVDGNRYIVIGNEEYIPMPDDEDIVSIHTYNDVVCLSKETLKIHKNTYGMNVTDHTWQYVFLERKTGKPILKDQLIRQFLYTEDDRIFAFRDDDNTYILDDNYNIVKTFNDYLFGNAWTKLSYESKECFRLESKEAINDMNAYPKNDKMLIIDPKGNVRFEAKGNSLLNLREYADYRHYFYDKNELVLAKSTKYGDNFLNDWFVIRDKQGYLCCVNSKFERLYTFSDVTDLKVFITTNGKVYFAMARNGRLYLYDENWVNVADEYVIHTEYVIRYNRWPYGEEKEHRRVNEFSYQPEKNCFRYNVHYAKLNRGEVDNVFDYDLYNSDRYLRGHSDWDAYVFCD